MKWLKEFIAERRRQSLWRLSQRILRQQRKMGIPEHVVRRATFVTYDQIFHKQSADYRIKHESNYLEIVPKHYVYPGENLDDAVAEYAKAHANKDVTVEILHKRQGTANPNSTLNNEDGASYEIVFYYSVMHETPCKPFAPEPPTLYVRQGYSLEDAAATARARISSYYDISHFVKLPKVSPQAESEVN